MDDLRISALLCTRLCHDLIGPAGAVANGVELLSENTCAVDDEVIELIRLSAFETTRRLKYFRLALGVPTEGQMITAVRVIADDYFATGRIELDWSDAILETPSPRPPLSGSHPAQSSALRRRGLATRRPHRHRRRPGRRRLRLVHQGDGRNGQGR